MSILKFLKMIFCRNEKSFDIDKIERVFVPTPEKPTPVNYLKEFDDMKNYFGKLYKIRVTGTEIFNYHILHSSLPVGVYYGRTKFSGECNRNGVKGVLFCSHDGSATIPLERKNWKKYEREAESDNLFWYGYSDGESMSVCLTKGKVLEKSLIDWLKNVGGWIRDHDYYESISEWVKSLGLPDGEFTYKKAHSQYDYDFYYWNRYFLAGVKYHVSAPFVSFGVAKFEPDNKYNHKAVAIYTDTGIKVGYIAEKELSKYRKEVDGVDNIPLVLESHFYNGVLYGNAYTFTRHKNEYTYMVNQFLRLEQKMEEQKK
ncbi:MAG TPA: hypothetical protein IAC71_04605 [Candidatus Caccomonas pullistercoris]|nr:hypothetical protein [Candidatus Caccomonas pullistercoris]